MLILIAHHQEEVRSAISFLLSQEANVHVVGFASNLEELLKELRSTHPDVVLLDCDLPGKPLVEHIAELQEEDEDLKVVVLCSKKETGQAALAAGAHTLIDERAHPKQIVTALRVLQLEGEYE